MNNGVQLCGFEEDGVTVSVMLRPAGEGQVAIELQNHFPAMRSIAFSPSLLEQVIRGESECIETPDRQCALVREESNVNIVFCRPDVGSRVACSVPVKELEQALSQVNGGSAYAA